jgi:hypothetical protein
LKNAAHAAKNSAKCCIKKQMFSKGVFLMGFSIFTKQKFTQNLYLPRNK